MTFSPTATTQLRALLSQPEPKLIRVGVKNRGCSGLAYSLEYVEKPGKFDEIVEQDGVRVLIDSKALFSIIGSEMDWQEDKLNQRFVFKNPNISKSHTFVVQNMVGLVLTDLQRNNADVASRSWYRLWVQYRALHWVKGSEHGNGVIRASALEIIQAQAGITRASKRWDYGSKCLNHIHIHICIYISSNQPFLHMTLPISPLTSNVQTIIRSKYPRLIVQNSRILHNPIQTLHKRQMRRILLQVIFPVFFVLEFDYEAVGEAALLLAFKPLLAFCALYVDRDDVLVCGFGMAWCRVDWCVSNGLKWEWEWERGE